MSFSVLRILGASESVLFKVADNKSFFEAFNVAQSASLIRLRLTDHYEIAVAKPWSRRKAGAFGPGKSYSINFVTSGFGKNQGKLPPAFPILTPLPQLIPITYMY
jgi:hypothetical protein